MKQQGWIASLSNGETVFERPWRDLQTGQFVDLGSGTAEADGLTPWQALLKRLTDEGLRVTQLQVQRGGLTIVSRKRADAYVCCYELHASMFGGGVSHSQGIGFVHCGPGDPGLCFMNWVNNQGHVWQDVRPLHGVGGLFIHSTLDLK